MIDRLMGPRAKVERAKKHIDELETVIQTFRETKPYELGTKRNPETRQLIYYVERVEAVPLSMALIAGDALQCLRSALDHLAYQLVLDGTGQPGPFRHPQFPIAESAAKYETNKLRQIEGARQEAIKAIDEVKPYKGGNDQLWVLSRLNNVDKHRLLITVVSAFRGFKVVRHILRDIRRVGRPGDFRPPADLPDIQLLLGPTGRRCPLKAGDELFIDGPEAEVDEDLKFAFDVAFSEAEIGEAEPVLETLVQITDAVQDVLESFRPLLA